MTKKFACEAQIIIIKNKFWIFYELMNKLMYLFSSLFVFEYHPSIELMWIIESKVSYGEQCPK